MDSNDSAQGPKTETGTPIDGGTNTTQAAPVIPPERLDALKKNLAYIWQESLELTGLPPDVLFSQVFRNASQQGLPANGNMLDFGQGPSFAPDKDTMTIWMNAFFARVTPQLAAPTTMPEA